MQSSKPLYSYVAAGILALITVFTFFVYQDFGPQSAIRRFHLDVYRKDLSGVNALTTDGVNAPATRQMMSFVASLFEANSSYEVVSLRRSHGEVLAAVEYLLPNRTQRAILWHVKQDQMDWRIDCRATLNDMYPQRVVR